MELMNVSIRRMQGDIYKSDSFLLRMLKKIGMPDINDIHRFYEANLPEYQRRDVLAVSRGLLRQMGHTGKKPYKYILANFEGFKEFVAIDWFGNNEIVEPGNRSFVPKKKGFGECSCGGQMVKRQNRSDKSFFLGCSRWPKCNQTKPYLL